MKKPKVSLTPTPIKCSPCNWTRIQRVERAVMLFAVIVILLDMLVWRPN